MKTRLSRWRGILFSLIGLAMFAGCNDGGRITISPVERKVLPPHQGNSLELPPGPGSVQLAAGAAHTCAAFGKKVTCWGLNNRGQLGDGSPLTHRSFSMNPGHVIEFSSRVISIAASHHTCVVLEEGDIACWGRGDDGQLGKGRLTNSSHPVISRLPDKAVHVSVGEFHTCAVSESQNVFCWGRNTDHQTGRVAPEQKQAWPTLVADDSPTPVVLNQIKKVALGKRHSCALSENRRIYCWGKVPFWTDKHPFRGEDSIIRDSSYSVVLAQALASGSNFLCAQVFTGGLQCWGSNQYRQLGHPAPTEGGPGFLTAPAPLSWTSSIDVFGTFEAGDHHACAVVSGSLYCWGENTDGQLGRSTGLTAPEWASRFPVDSAVLDPTQVAHLSAGYQHTCVSTQANQVYCWGSNASEQLGFDTTGFSPPDRSWIPQLVHSF